MSGCFFNHAVTQPVCARATFEARSLIRLTWRQSAPRLLDCLQGYLTSYITTKYLIARKKKVLKVSLVIAFVQQTNILASDWDLDQTKQEKFDHFIKPKGYLGMELVNIFCL